MAVLFSILSLITLIKQHLTYVGLSKKTSDIVGFLLLLMRQGSGTVTLSDR